MEQKYYSFEEGGHRGGPSLRNRVWVIQPVLHHSEEGWRVMTYFRSVSFEPLSQDATEVQHAHTNKSCLRWSLSGWSGLVCDDRSKRCTCLHPSSSQEVPEVCFWGQKLTNTKFFLFVLALWPHTFTVCGYCSGSSMIPGHPHTQLHRLVDVSSIRAWGDSTSRCRSRSHERAGG